jgi:atrial natriuretic peptide receptor A
MKISVTEDDDNDLIARKSFEALLRVSLLQPTSPRFNQFADDVRNIAEKEYGYQFVEGEEVRGFCDFYIKLKVLRIFQNRSIFSEVYISS